MDGQHNWARRFGGMFLLSAAAWAQSAPATRLLIVDAWRSPVRSAARRPLEPPQSDVCRNESAAIDASLNYVDAQWIYFRGRSAFAEKIRSASGQRDGLYWPLDADGEESPMGPRFAAAAAAELNPADARPLFGYYFKIVEVQGSAKGFALIAWPARYGVTGVRVFLVSHQGEVYARDLGADTSRLAASIKAFAPDGDWTKVASTSD